MSTWMSLVPALVAALAAAGGAPALEGGGRVRVSVKHVLDAAGRRSQGHYTRSDQVRAAIAEANAVLVRSGASWRLELTEVASIRGAEPFFEVAGAAEFRLLERSARENPGPYLFREGAVNIYLVNALPARAVACFPGEGDIIAVNNVRGFPNGGAGWLHEIGHFLSLTHTYECYSDGGCSPGACTGEAAAHAGPRGRVQCPDTCPDGSNVMSAGNPSAATGRLTPCQLREMDHELRDPEGSRTAVFAPPGEAAAPLFRRGDADGDGTIGLPDALRVLHHLFRSGAPASCPDAADAGDDGVLGMTDAVHVLAHLFAGGPPPAAPAGECGADPTEDALACEGQAHCAD